MSLSLLFLILLNSFQKTLLKIPSRLCKKIQVNFAKSIDKFTWQWYSTNMPSELGENESILYKIKHNKSKGE